MNEKLKIAFDNYRVALSMSKLPGITKLSKRYIKDKTKPREWNLEYVKENNERYAKELEMKSNDRSYSIQCAKDKIIKCIRDETGSTEKGARMLLESAVKYSGENDSYGTQGYVEDMIEIIKAGFEPIVIDSEISVYAQLDENGCCTNCGKKINYNDFNYCPWCGAEMLKERA